MSLLSLIMFILPFLLLVPTTLPQTAKAQPALLALANEQPDTPVSVIIQKATPNNDVETSIAKLGGVITKNLPIINAFAAELPAQAAVELARDSSVIWVSLDAPIIQDSGTGDPHLITLQSEFNQTTYDDGRSTIWTEIGENDGPELGSVAITNFLGGTLTGLRIQEAEKGIQRQFDLTEAANATLSFGYRRKGFKSESDYIALEISTDGGSNWTELDRLSGPATDPNLMFVSYDLAPFVDIPFTLRFISSANLNVEGKFYIDYVKVAYQAAVSERETIELAYQIMLPIVMTSGKTSPATTPMLDAPMYMTDMEIVRDSFNANAYSNNDGTIYWQDSWTEYDPDGGQGANGGYVYVQNGRLTFDWAYNEHIIRHVDLSNHNHATLSFDWQTSGLDSGEAISILVSKDGLNFTELDSIGGSQSVSSQYDISHYISNNTTIKFTNTGPYWEYGEYAYIDNVQIDLSPVATSLTTRTARDEFNAIDWSNNDGTEKWNDSWHEHDRGGNGPSTGYVYINDGRLYFHYALINLEHAYRTINLTGSTQATLTFDWQTIGLDYGETISVLVSKGSSDAFVELEQFGGSQNGSASYDISAYISDNTTIRIENKSNHWEIDEYAIFDNIQIAHSCVECIETSNLGNTYVQAIHADQVWNEPPYLQGQGVTVAIVDSGVSEHIDLTDAAGNSRILTHVQFMTDDNPSDDLYGHGTHIAGSIAGNGQQSNGVYMGVAPKANLVDVKVIDDHGAGYTSDVVAGIQWIYENHEKYNIRIANLSLNSAVIDSYHKNPLDAALEILWFNGITVVVSAGNNGTSQLYAPANDPFFIAVGATDDRGTVDTSDDILASFSAHGTTQEDFQKPDILAPGVNIISLIASDDGNLMLEHPDHIVVNPDGNSYFRMSGTSMSSAITSGAIALLLQDEPNLNPDQVKYRLITSDNGSTPPSTSAVYLDVPAVIHGTTTETANTNLTASQLLWSGDNPINWGSVNWGSVNWGSVNWGSVNWGSVNWGSVNWGSGNWDE